MTKKNWNQPLCDPCWDEMVKGRRVPVRLTNAALERCCMCDKETRSGIYYRIDPDDVPFPTGPDEEEL